MFEQSGTFKQEFIKLGIPAIDLDIQNNFGQTDMQIDLFEQIETAYTHTHTHDAAHTIFDDISKDDLIMAFFPCIYFETVQQIYFSLRKHEFANKTMQWQIDYALDRLDKRTYFHKLLYKLVYVIYEYGLRFIMENPATTPNYLITGQNFMPQTFIDKNRMLRGDVFSKPTAYWFINCEPTHLMTIYKDKKQQRINDKRGSKQAGLCSEERSMISPDYARNFIHDFILGKPQKMSQLNLFE